MIRGVRTAAPTKLLPVMKMPLRHKGGERDVVSIGTRHTKDVK